MTTPTDSKGTRVEFSMPWVQQLGQWFIKELNLREYKAKQYPHFNERPVEYAYVFSALARLYPANILDIGCGQSALPNLMTATGSLVTAIDNIVDYWPAGMINRHHHVMNEDISAPKGLLDHAGKFDCVTCISVLEHIADCNSAISNMLAMLRPGGHLILSFPYNEQTYIENAYDLPNAGYGQDASYVCKCYSRENLNSWFPASKATIVDQTWWQIFTGEYWTVGERVIPAKQSSSEQLHHLTCLLVQKNNSNE